MCITFYTDALFYKLQAPYAISIQPEIAVICVHIEISFNLVYYSGKYTFYGSCYAL